MRIVLFHRFERRTIDWSVLNFKISGHQTYPSIFAKFFFQVNILDADANILTSNIEFRGHCP